MNIEIMIQEYSIPEYLAGVILTALFLGAIFLLLVLARVFKPRWKFYRTDTFHNMTWKWRYKGDKVIDLWCYCPTCESMLIVDDDNSRATSNLGDKATFFICHKCGDSKMGRIKGGDRHYVLKSITRSILAKIRLKTFEVSNGK
ncbi:MAG: hypothetical protein JJV95_05940 [Sulfurospirillum sp.]|nr:hypothetical protein [Sulfurospirillum sp.]